MASRAGHAVALSLAALFTAPAARAEIVTYSVTGQLERDEFTEVLLGSTAASQPFNASFTADSSLIRFYDPFAIFNNVGVIFDTTVALISISALQNFSADQVLYGENNLDISLTNDGFEYAILGQVVAGDIVSVYFTGSGPIANLQIGTIACPGACVIEDTGVFSASDAFGYFSELRVQRVNPSAVPEPATWAMMIGGFGLVGSAARRRQNTYITYA